MANQKKIRRFIPCSLYCTAKIESWLEEMAAEGFVFYTFSKFDYAVFLKEEPKKIRYRLCIKGSNKHEPEIQKLMRKYGWERSDEIKNLIVFSSQAPQPFEADDERELSELRDKAIKYHSNQNIISSLLPLLPVLLFIFFKGSAISAVNFGIEALLLPISMILFIIARQIIETIDIKTYKKHISDKNAYIKNTSKINLALYAAKYISVTAVFLSLILVFASSEGNSDIRYYSSVEKENPPFATVEDFVSENVTIKSEADNDTGAMYNKWSNAVSTVNYNWFESDMVTLSDGTTEEIQINVNYHKTISSVLAKWLIWDYYQEDKSLEIKSDVNKISGYDIDYGLTYRNWGFLVIIAQKGNTIIKAEIQSPGYLSDEEAIEIICNNF